MKIIKGKRGSGKTTQAIIQSSSKWQYILVSNSREAQHIAQMANEMKLHIPYPITAYELLTEKLTSPSIGHRGIIVDNALDVLQELINIPIEMVTINMECEEE